MAEAIAGWRLRRASPGDAAAVRAHRFYERQGFVIAGARQFRVGKTLHDDRIYARAL